MCASASAAQLASLSTNTGTPKRRPSSSRSGTPASGMFTLVSTVPVANSICDGTPTPIASGCPASAITSRTTCSIAVEQGVGADGDRGVLHCVRVAVTPSTAATATFVPPTSTPRTTRDSYLRERGPASLADSGGVLVEAPSAARPAARRRRPSRASPAPASPCTSKPRCSSVTRVLALLGIEGDLDLGRLAPGPGRTPLGRQVPGQQDAVRALDLAAPGPSRTRCRPPLARTSARRRGHRGTPRPRRLLRCDGCPSATSRRSGR